MRSVRSMLRTLSGPIQNITFSSELPASAVLTKDEEKKKLCEFKQAIKQFDILYDLEREDFYYMKWLRARGFDVEKAKEMLKKHLEWRIRCEYLHGVMYYAAPNEVLEQLQWKRVGNDDKGRPIFCILLGKMDLDDLIKKGYLEELKKYAHKIFEIFRLARNDQWKSTGYGKIIVIIDMNEFTVEKAMSIQYLQLAKYFVCILEANYPDSLHKALILNSSWFFTTVYNACKHFLAQETINKIQIYGFDQTKYFPDLEDTIPFELIPEEYGGPGDSISRLRSMTM